MKQRLAAPLILFAATFLLSCTLGSSRAADISRPNIILVMADDQGWGDTGYNGHPVVQTPTMDAMAEEGFVFDRFYAASPVCSPTRASVLTGRNPIRTNVANYGLYLRPQEQTLAETLQTAGYVTGIFGKLHIGSAQPSSPCNPGGMGFDEWVVGLNFFDNDPYLSANGTVRRYAGKGSVVLMDEALSFIRKHRDSEAPIFTVIWFPSPHYPHAEVPEEPDLYSREKHAGYFREITLLDEQLGRLRRELRELGMAGNTILWYCSDNGGLLEASSGGRAKKGQVYEGGLRVPSLLEWPARQLKGRSSVPASTNDMMPTLLAMVGVEAELPHPLDGVNITGMLHGTMAERDDAIGFWHQLKGGDLTHSDRILKTIMTKQEAGLPEPHDSSRLLKDVYEFPQYPEDTTKGHAAWLDWPWKLHRIDGSKYELYNLADDPMEQEDLSKDKAHGKHLEQMQGELAEWQRSVIRSLNGQDYSSMVTE